MTDKKLIIPIDEFESSAEIVYVGERSRPSSVTSVVLLDPNTLACCHFDGCKIFIFRFDLEKGTYYLLDFIDTTFSQEKCQTDLIASDGRGNLIVTNAHKQTCSLYRYENEKISHAKDLQTNVGNFTHGIKFYSSNIIAVTSRYNSGGVFFIDYVKDELIYHLRIPNVSVQDVCFFSQNRAAIVMTNGSPAYGPKIPYPSALLLIDLKIEGGAPNVIKQRVLDNSHLDCIVEYKNQLYFTDQYNNKVIICEPESLKSTNEMHGYSFPHGLDVNHGIIAVTNYGNNTVELRRLSANTA